MSVTPPSSATQSRTDAPIGIGERVAYGVGDMATGLLQVTVAAFLTFYYTDTLLLSAAVVGTIIATMRIVDAFVDLAVGTLVDRTRTRWGKARPFLLWLAIPYGISGVLLFTVPNVGETWKYVYVAAAYFLMNVIYSAINVPYGVLNSLITRNQQSRAVLNLFRTGFAMASALLVSYIAIPTVTKLGGGQHGWVLFAIGVGVAASILWLVTFAFTRERVGQQVDGEVPKEAIPFRTGIKALFKNKYWAMLLGISFIQFAYQSVNGGINVYYIQYIIGDLSLIGPLSLVGILPLLVTLPLLAPIIKKFGKRNTALMGFSLIILGSLLLAIDPSSVPLLFASAVIRGIGGAPFAGTFFAMLADTIEYGEWKTGVRNEGLVYSAGSFGTKAGTGFGTAVLGWSLTLGGYVGGQEVISDSASSTIVFLFVWLPIIVYGLLGVMLSFYKLDKEYPQIIADLKVRHAADTDKASIPAKSSDSSDSSKNSNS